MRRIALMVLIALLPLQSIWAAAANVCQDRCSAAGKHFGQHEHHQALILIADDASAGIPSEPGSTCGTDCSTYHGHGSLAVFQENCPLQTVLRPAVAMIPYQLYFADRYLEIPLRPPQHALA